MQLFERTEPLDRCESETVKLTAGIDKHFKSFVFSHSLTMVEDGNLTYVWSHCV